MFCREAVTLLRGRAAPSEVLFVAQGDAEQASAFFSRAWPEARAVCDPDQRLYAAFGLGRGSAGQLLGPAVWAAGLRALRRGARLGRPVGDPRVMSGAFLVRGEAVLWSHTYAHAGDHPDFDAALAQLRELRDEG